MSARKTMRQVLAEEKCVLAPEVYDCASAWTVEQCGYKATVLSGAEVSMSLKGIPDLGILTFSEILMVTRNICDFSPLPMIVDCEDGYGPMLTAAYNCEKMAKAGAGGVIIVDSPGTRIGGPNPALPLDEALAKYRACADALKGSDCILVARTDVPTLDEAIERCVAYREAGADMTLAFMINSLHPRKRYDACKQIAARDKGWKWYPDLGCHDGKSDVTVEEVAAIGFNFVGVHYLLSSAISAMMDAGRENFKNQNNVYSTLKYPASGLGSPEQLQEWYEREKKFSIEPNLENHWPYNYYHQYDEA